MSKALRILYRFLVLLSIVSLAACSSIKTLYNQLDWLLPWYLDDYVSLNEQQEGVFEKQLASAIQWHRQHQLPQYADFLDTVAVFAKDGLDEKEIDIIYRDVRGFIDLLIEGLVLQFSDLIRHMDEQQLGELSSNLEQKNLQFSKKYIDTAETIQRDKRAEDKLQSIEFWTGSVTEQQKKIVERWSQSYLLMGEEYLESRLRWQQRLKQVLEQREAQVDVTAQLLNLVRQRRAMRSETFFDKKRVNDRVDKQLYLELDQSLNSQQRAFLLKKLTSTARDFRELADQDS